MGLLSIARGLAETYWQAQGHQGNAGSVHLLTAEKVEQWQQQAVYRPGGAHAEKTLLTALYAQFPPRPWGNGFTIQAPTSGANIRLYSYFTPCRMCAGEMKGLPAQVRGLAIAGVRWRLGWTAHYLKAAADPGARPNAYDGVDDALAAMEMLRVAGWEVKRIPPPAANNAQAFGAAAAPKFAQ